MTPITNEALRIQFSQQNAVRSQNGHLAQASTQGNKKGE
jgi:hypothetical protein